MVTLHSSAKTISKGLAGLGLCVAIAGGIQVSPVAASETVSFWYGPFQRSLPIADLHKYAETGDISTDLAGMFRFVKPQTRQEVRKVLNYKVPLDVVTLDRLLEGDPGTNLLKKFAPAFIRKDDAGVVALRGGLILGAASKDGLSVLSFLEAYPNAEVSLSIPQLLEALKSAKDLPSLLLGS